MKDIEHFAAEQGEAFDLTLVVEERPPLGDDEPKTWFAALKQMNVPMVMAPTGVAILGTEAPSRWLALIGLAQLLDTIPDSEREWLLRRLAD
jgi:hypothetical protein